MVAELNKANVKAPRGGEWTLVQVQRVLARCKESDLALSAQLA